MTMLEVPGARLHYDQVGTGPLLVFVTGAGGDGDLFKQAASHLAGDFTVVTYDRRGFARSELVGEQDYTRRIHTDGDDIAALIDHAGIGPAVVFGSSSGGVVALNFMTDHPAAFTRLVAHEPAAISALPNASEAQAGIDKTYAAYQTHGMQAALGGFVQAMMTKSDQEFLAAGAVYGDPAQRARNMAYWFEHELRQYPRVQFDWEAIRADAARLMVVVGDESEGLPPHRMAMVVAQRAGVAVHEVPGGHLGYATQPEAFARALTGLLKG